MNIKFLALLVLLAVAIFIGTSAASDVSDQEQPVQVITARDRFKLPKLFDFEYFKQLFKKSYAGFIEEMRRQKLFVGQAIRAFLSAIKYKHKLSSYFLSVNHYSDWTPQEKNRLKSNIVITDDLKQVVIDKESGNILSEKPLAADVKIIGKEPEDMMKYSLEPNGNLHEQKRNKRDIDRSDEVSRKENINPRASIQDMRNLVVETARRLRESNTKSTISDKEPDEIYIDHRLSNCMHPVGNQGDCGSCYAFASIAYFEYHLCLATGYLFKLAEQYIVDCGPQAHELLAGCNGGSEIVLGQFYSRAGFELASRYPYTEKVGTCPYNITESTTDTSPGYFRVKNVEKIVGIDMKYAELMLQNEPLYISIGSAMPDFDSYGGGVHDGKECCGPNHITRHCGNHAMLLIGFGREDGEEYWLIRNSYGTDWGEDGHFKLNRKSDCIHPQIAWRLGADFLNQQVILDPQVNRDHKLFQDRLK